MEIDRALLRFAHEDLGWDRPLDPGASLIDEGLLDSLALLELIRFVEEEFEVDVDEEDVVPENFECLAAISAYVRARLEVQRRGTGLR
jgi:acyl carrier protein